MKNYTRINNIVGWFIFLVAAFVFISCTEPTASFWDCGEFTPASFKLEIGHPPGAPLFLMLGRIFMIFAGSNLQLASVMLNIMCALMSAFAILFLFWTITAIGKKLAMKSGELTENSIMTIMAAGIVGSLAFTFSDSIWFSAEEAIVWAGSQFFTSCVVWLIFKWDAHADEKYSSHYLILIAYMVGLSTGVHLLNLLTMPALAFVYYFRKFTPTPKGIILTTVIALAVTGFVMIGVRIHLVSIAAAFDFFFVNTMGLPFGSGIIFFTILFVGLILWGLINSKKNGKPYLNYVFLAFSFIIMGWDSGIFTWIVLIILYIAIIIWGGSNISNKNDNPYLNVAILAFSFLVIGCLCFGQVVVRSHADPPLNENDPGNVYNLLSFLNREQYGERPLLYGQYYNAKVIRYDHGSTNYTKVKGQDKYVAIGERVEPVYEEDKCTIFPRMFSAQQNHINVYKDYGGVKGDKTPTFGQNLTFFFTYQVAAMYWRYFLWNFVGRQNDEQGPGGLTRGNAISGIKFIDSMFLGDQDKLPQSMLTNKARITLFGLPLILGLIGLFYHYSKDNKDAWVVLLLFFMTGLAIIIYLNQTPQQPRERDYSYAASFYAFTIWIGIGVMGLIEYAKKQMKEITAIVLVFAVCLLAVPVLMAKQNWASHDRSHRFTSRDFAYDYLNSCAPNAILFTNGDNDTFPLWFAQEVEGIRTDVRVVNLSLLNTDWYINQLKHQYYTSDALPLTIPSEKYLGEKLNVVYYVDNGVKDTVELKDLLEFVVNDPRSIRQLNNGENINYFSAKNIKITVDPQAAINTGTVSKENAGKIVKEVEWTYGSSYIEKNALIILDLLAHNNWKRPIYFATTVGTENFLGLEDYFQLEGLTYRLVPIKGDRKNNEGEFGTINTSIMYNNLMNKFDWGNMNNPKVYMDENNQRMTTNVRINCSRLAQSLLAEGKRELAEKVLDKSIEMMPDTNVPYNFFVSDLPELYYSCYATPPGLDSLQASQSPDFAKQKRCIEKGNAIVKRLFDIYADNTRYYLSLKSSPSKFRLVTQELRQSLYVMQKLASVTKQFKQKALNEAIESQLNSAMGQTGDIFQQ